MPQRKKQWDGTKQPPFDEQDLREYHFEAIKYAASIYRAELRHRQQIVTQNDNKETRIT
eukprot:CAMPEP_0202734460 /NCGR_PEP_ID=MMETSP1385-20130828/188696_1 /ASSEMBLY_ACC=CAM_ASM_000861 /TAXON_ID=933848 /ORGANISM="Elphidium margaritaceum" /LENGTH=58 /DNA_ID=CAMNT_0049400823 /DNA_START=723 /DNA_END=895 /DNA_ORIENTATION=+